MKKRILFKFSIKYIFLLFSLSYLIKGEIEEGICETGKDVNEFKDCLGKKVNINNYCCFVHLSYLGPHAKYCIEFPKIDIENNRIKNTIRLIEDGKYWEGRIQSYDIHSIECDYSFGLKINVMLFILFLFFLV